MIMVMIMIMIMIIRYFSDKHFFIKKLGLLNIFLHLFTFQTPTYPDTKTRYLKQYLFVQQGLPFEYE